MTEHLGFPIETVIVFVVLSLGAIVIDLYAHRDDKPMSLKSASLWSVFWIFVSLAFGAYLWMHHGSDTASLFITGYALEKVLSVDNLFVMMAIFTWFKVPEGYRHRVLYWGIIGAIVFRMVFVAIGTGLLALGPYVELVFALIVAWTGYMMLKSGEEEEEEEDYSEHLAYRLVHKFFPVWPRLYGHNFFLNGAEIEKARDAGFFLPAGSRPPLAPDRLGQASLVSHAHQALRRFRDSWGGITGGPEMAKPAAQQCKTGF